MGGGGGGALPQRVDLGSLRSKILVALGPDKARKYWDTFKRFTRFTLSKEELDVIARDVLGPDNIPLHNEFVRGIFQNALLGTINPPAHEIQIPDPIELGGDTKKPKRKVTSQGTIVVQGAQQQQQQKPPSASHDQVWINAQELHRMQWKICDGADLYDESWELPSLVGIRHKMRRRGVEHGLVVDHKAVECLHKTLENYMGNIILACKEVSDIRRSSHLPAVSTATPSAPHHHFSIQPSSLNLPARLSPRDHNWLFFPFLVSVAFSAVFFFPPRQAETVASKIEHFAPSRGNPRWPNVGNDMYLFLSGRLPKTARRG